MLFLVPADTCGGVRPPAPEISFDVWDWTEPARNLRTFEEWARDMRAAGVTRLELSVPWNVVEPEPGRIDLAWLRERHAVCRRHGLGMRLRINSYYGGAMPQWYRGDLWKTADGNAVPGVPIPSINDDRFWERYGAVCTAIARELRGEDVLYNAFIGIHAELKYADWWTFDDASLGLWRQCIAPPRPEWLARVAGHDAGLPATPAIPAQTDGRPDLSAASRAFIAFREWTWRRALERFADAIRAGDPNARISSPLGESFRRESAAMSNLDYWGLSRQSCQVVHSYDFFIHGGSTPLWHVAATIASFQGITRLPVSFEFDSPETIEQHGYDAGIQKAVARTVAGAGAGLKFANFSYYPRLPGSWPIIAYAGELARTDAFTTAAPAPESRTVLLFFSKWANYCYREKSEWLHDAQFGWWKLLSDLGVPARIVCEDNLGEELDAYRGIVLAFSPEDVMPPADVAALAALPLPRVADVRLAPAGAPGGMPADPARAATAAAGSPKEVVLGFAMGYHYLHAADTGTLRAAALTALNAAGIATPALETVKKSPVPK